MNIPAWAKLIGAVVLAGMSALGVFVTRWEYTALHTDVRETRKTVEMILWNLGGPISRDVAPPMNVDCIREGEMENVPVYLDNLWVRAQEITRTTSTGERPRFCFVPGPFALSESGRMARLLGLYDRRTNTALIALGESELETHGRCVILHEMIHALSGKDEVRVRALLEEAGEACPHGG